MQRNNLLPSSSPCPCPLPQLNHLSFLNSSLLVITFILLLGTVFFISLKLFLNLAIYIASLFFAILINEWFAQRECTALSVFPWKPLITLRLVTRKKPHMIRNKSSGWEVILAGSQWLIYNLPPLWSRSMDLIFLCLQCLHTHKSVLPLAAISTLISH